jgi:SNW domain-containing protein 1
MVGEKRGRKDKTNAQDERKEAEKKERDEIRRLLRKENERTRRREQAGLNKTKNERDADRDISEKIALGQAQPTTKDVMFDQRLFNQTAGLGQGFGDDEDYNLYDKPLFTDRTAAGIYKNVNRETG